ncbi:L-allo-threonine aldolase [Aureococcus anophagefferens]|nr:L-allo-threonine aldolase [Aureococcus anophagefferens]
MMALRHLQGRVACVACGSLVARSDEGRVAAVKREATKVMELVEREIEEDLILPCGTRRRATALVAPRQTATRTIARLAAAEPVVDLRSDTVTQPTAAMRAAMGAAVCGDDVFGDDPTVAKLEARVGDLLGKEAAVFVPTGTMGNLVSILAHCWERGSEYVVGDCAHVHIFEQGGASQFGGAHARAVPTAADGTIGDAAAVRALVRVDDQHFPAAKVVALEDTHNLRGGAALPAGYGAAVAAAVRTSASPRTSTARASGRRAERFSEAGAPTTRCPRTSSTSASTSAPGFSAGIFVDHCADRGVRFLVVPGSTRMRMVCHQTTADGAERALAVIKAACDSGLR